MVTYHRQLRLVERYHQHCLYTILNIHWSNFTTNIEVLEMAKVTSIEAMLLKTQLCWRGHFSGMEDHCLPKIALYGELSTGHRNKGAPRKRYKHTLKRSLTTCNIDHRQWTTQATNRTNWRRTVYQATTSFETTRRANTEDKRRIWKHRDPSEINIKQIVTCGRCGKTCLSRIGSISHQRPAPDEDFLLPVPSFAKQSHDGDNCSMFYFFNVNEMPVVNEECDSGISSFIVKFTELAGMK